MLPPPTTFVYCLAIIRVSARASLPARSIIRAKPAVLRGAPRSDVNTNASRLAETHPPVTALREWLLLFVDYIATKHGMFCTRRLQRG
jgi:hypothetical protein